jgi:hypothetical protein
MVTMKKLGLLALFGVAIGCGSGGGGGAVEVTHTLVSNVPDSVAVGTCVAIEGPYDIGPGTTDYNLVDTPTGIGSDTMEVVILPDSVYLSEGCNFTVSQTVIDHQNVASDSGGPVSIDRDDYDFVVSCDNSIDDCFFNLTWTATY